MPARLPNGEMGAGDDRVGEGGGDSVGEEKDWGRKRKEFCDSKRGSCR